MSYSDEDVERILAAARTIERSLGVLAEKQSLSRSEYGRDRETRDVVERRFVKTTEAALDIAETILRCERGESPETNPGSMRALHDAGVLSGDVVEPMVRAARFRNVLAHTYGEVIDHDIVYDALQDLRRYRQFLAEVREFLERAGAFDG
jgi:uncharacterized protein YutE (UPF0331/DUF86 family)